MPSHPAFLFAEERGDAAAQVARLTSGVRLAARAGIAPSVVAGYGLGAFTAAVVAGVLALDDALELITERARILDEVCARQPGSAGVVAGLAAAQAERLCA